jgi:hypothetical protein
LSILGINPLSVEQLAKQLKYLGINLMKDIKDLSNENYTLKKKIEEDTRTWKDSHVHGLAELIL